MSGATQLAAVIGLPVRHSLSPAIFDAAFEAVGLDWTYLAFEVEPDALAAAVGAVGALGIRGLSVTMPHKAAILPMLDEVSATARRLGAVNCVTGVEGGRLVGDNTDGAGFVASLRAAGVELGDAAVAVLGAGGAARAIIEAAGAAGAREVVVVNRTAERAAVAAELAGSAGRVGEAGDVAAADVVVNATSVGMAPDVGIPIAAELLHEGQVVVDAVYHPLQTPLLVAAAGRGARPIDGLGMLIGQAAVAFERWTDVEAPLAAMRAAADRALAERAAARERSAG